jgi:hypothetical protein
MLRLSKKADYALIAMKHLAQKACRAEAPVREGGTSTSAREIAEQYDIPIERLHVEPPVEVHQCRRRDSGDRWALNCDCLLDRED